MGLFADPPSGSKGIFLGGGTYQLIVQAISAVSLTIWASTATLFILFIVNRIILIRLDPEDEKKGCDLSEHSLGESYGNEVLRSMTTLDKIIHISTPIAQRLAHSTEERNRRHTDSFGRRKPFHSNEAFDRGEERL